jgi:hypothetical protein
MIGLLTDEAINQLPIDQQARLKRLPDNMSIDIIAKLMMQPYQGVELDRLQKIALSRNRSAMKTSIIDACAKGLLAYEIFGGPKYKAPKPNSYLINDGASINLSGWGRGDFAKPKRDGVDGYAAIHKTEFKRYLQSVGMWPVSSHYPPELNMPYENLLGNWWTDDEQQAEVMGDVGDEGQDKTKPNGIELTQWLRETWIEEGKLGGTAFFGRLKKYEGAKGSPIIEHYRAGKDAGFKWQTSKGTTGEMKKSTLLNKVSAFKKTL